MKKGDKYYIPSEDQPHWIEFEFLNSKVDEEIKKSGLMLGKKEAIQKSLERIDNNIKIKSLNHWLSTEVKL